MASLDKAGLTYLWSNLKSKLSTKADLVNGKVPGSQLPKDIGDMCTSTYDTNHNGRVDDSDKLGGELPSYYAIAKDFHSEVEWTNTRFSDMKSSVSEKANKDHTHPGILSPATNGYNGAITSNANGVTEVGKYLEFHTYEDSTVDYSTRLVASGDHGNTVKLPSNPGTMLVGDRQLKVVISSFVPDEDDQSIITIVV